MNGNICTTVRKNIAAKAKLSSVVLLGALTIAACGGNTASGASKADFCKEVDSLWPGVDNALTSVEAARVAGISPVGYNPASLQRAATNAKKLSADAPTGQSAGGVDLKAYLGEVAQTLSAAADGNYKAPLPKGNDPMVVWNTINCSALSGSRS
ncbi:hypothetical protein BST27_24330 [Mycobacterium intermedium]|uniref:Uncharacterized protein n=1 Tax=Mycobacterium intermedium TaxID=28445 RepID=A0A1E3SJL5_MYCIE|nr:hypothetical protein [Mycobacterium intermedium]MCV6962580.1 hypothetical protein [Mycobacterium intermedium]ODR02350.1 hypothetical protein BHQ20_04480 [Mycobacterium intermedium]OPE52819.1 hypothetical protein BV508_00895 [Mycobacterium intermedium]ORA96741.1 hypothetical protein BST27_24330 [Mycobacterium intermedium]